MTSSIFRRSCLACVACLIVPAAATAQKLVTASGPGAPSTVRVIDASGTDRSFLAYDPAFLGGVRVALGDVNGDGVSDIVTAAGPGATPHVRVWNGSDLSVIGSFSAYEPTFAGGVFVAAGDVNGDGRAEIITGAGAGGRPQVRIWDATTFTEIARFAAYDPEFHGGVTVAAGDVDGDGVADIVTGTGPGGDPHVRVWSGASRAELGGFNAYSRSFRGGVNVAAGDIDGDGLADILTGGGPGGIAQVRAWSGANFTEIGAGFVAYDPGFSGGITVALVDLDRDGANEIVTGAMSGGPLVRVWTRRARGTRFTLVRQYFSFDPAGGRGGTFVASDSENNAGGNLRFVSATETTFSVGSPGTFTVRTKGGPKPALTVSGTLPAGVTFVDNGDRTATLAGTPAAGTGGTYPLVFTADNGRGTPVTQNFTLIIGQGPTITSANATTFTIGVAGTFTVTTTGTPTPAITATGALPSGVTFTDNGNGTATLAGTPAAGTAGTYPLTITATNSGGSATQDFTLTVQLACQTITITPAVMPGGFYQTVYAGVDFNQTGSTGSSFTWGATGLPAGLTIDPGTGVVSGTPTTTVLNAAVVVTVTDNFGCSGTLNTAITVRPFTDDDIYNGGVGNTQFVVRAMADPLPPTPAVSVIDNVKNGDNGPGPLSVTFNAPANGAVVEGPTDGTFIYTPNVAFAGPSDSFTYTLTDGNGVTNTGTVTINLGGLVWYVNSGAGAGDGRSHNPFNTLSAAGPPSGMNSTIYVHTGTGATTGNLAMDASQTLHGQGATFMLNGLTIAGAAALAPTLAGAVTLANDDIVKAVNFAGSGVAMTGSGLTGPVTIDQVNVSGGTTALSLTNVSGAVTVNSNSSFTNTTAAEVLISQGTGTVTIAAPISSTAGRAIDIQSRTSGTVTFTGAITDTGGTGILLNNNGTSTFSFSGGLTLNGTGTTFTATNPSLTGTLTITGTNTIGATTPPTAGTALNVSNITIGASGLTFRSISANGAASGIVLNNTGATGGLTVTGNSAGLCGGQVTVNPVGTPATVTAPVTGDCTGGTIQSTSGAGIVLTNTSNVSLTRIRIANAANDGIQGQNVSGFSLIASLVENNGDAVAEANLDFGDIASVTPDGLHGAGAITNSTIRGGAERNVSIRNLNGAALTGFNVTGTQISNNSAELGSDDGILMEVIGTASMSIDVQGSYFAANRGDHFQASGSNSGDLTVLFRNNTLAGGHTTALGQGLTINVATGVASGGYTGQVVYDIDSNTINGAISNGIAVVQGTSGAAASVVGRIRNNVIGTSGASLSCSTQANGVYVDARGNGTHTSAVTNNIIRQCFDRGILSEAGDGDPILNLTVQGNIIDQQVDAMAREAIQTNHGLTTTNVFGNVDSPVVCLQLGGAGALANVFSHGAGAPDDFRLRKRFEASVRLPGYAGGTGQDVTSLDQVVAFVRGQNTGSAGEPGSASASGTGGGFTGGAACPLPPP